MCGRYVSKIDAALERDWALTRPPPLFESYNIAPTTAVPVVRERDGQRLCELLRWGLVPFWAKGIPPKLSTINARIETIATARQLSRRPGGAASAASCRPWASTNGRCGSPASSPGTSILRTSRCSGSPDCGMPRRRPTAPCSSPARSSPCRRIRSWPKSTTARPGCRRSSAARITLPGWRATRRPRSSACAPTPRTSCWRTPSARP